MAGGGIKGGQVYGKTDKEGREVIENKVEVPAINATIAYALGLPLDQVIYSPEQAPVHHRGQGPAAHRALRVIAAQLGSIRFNRAASTDAALLRLGQQEATDDSFLGLFYSS